MRTPKYLLLLALSVMLLALPACDALNDRLEEINTDPNNPTAVPLAVMLPNVEMNIIFSLTGADPSWYSSVLVQHTAGVHAQLRDADLLITSDDPRTLNNTWNMLYAGVLKDLQVMIEDGTEGGHWHYVAVSKILKAYSLGFGTDLWGRIPYSTALRGEDGTPEAMKPTYDAQASIYQEVQRLLDEAIADIGKATVGRPAADDLIYQGNMAKWRMAAYSLKAKFHNRLSKRDPAGSANAAIAAAANGFASRADDLMFAGFQSAAAHQHPWWREWSQRRHHAHSARMHTILTDRNDPRLPLWAQPMPSGPNAGQIVPAPNGAASPDQGGALYSKLGFHVINATAPMQLMTYPELQFIKAEAHLRLGQADQALAAYTAAVGAALDQAGVSAAAKAAYMAQSSVIPTAASALTQEEIMIQKWLVLFPFQAAEAYNEWRRTGFPTLTNPQGVIPRRYPYAQNEFDSNFDNVPKVAVTSGVWWDDGTED
jgi:hypothetical protein